MKNDTSRELLTKNLHTRSLVWLESLNWNKEALQTCVEICKHQKKQDWKLQSKRIKFEVPVFFI